MSLYTTFAVVMGRKMTKKNSKTRGVERTEKNDRKLSAISFEVIWHIFRSYQSWGI